MPPRRQRRSAAPYSVLAETSRRGHAAEQHAEIVGRHLDRRGVSEAALRRERCHIAEVADAPGRVAPTQIFVEAAIALGGVGAVAAERTIEVEEPAFGKDAARSGEK